MTDPMPAIRSILGMPEPAPTVVVTQWQTGDTFAGPLIFETANRWTLEINGKATHFMKAAWTRRETI